MIFEIAKGGVIIPLFQRGMRGRGKKNYMNILFGIVIFIIILFFLELGYLAFRTTWNPEKRQSEDALNSLSFSGDENEAIDLRKKVLYSEVPWLNRALSSLRRWKECNVF